MIPIWYHRFKYRIISLCYHFKAKKIRNIRDMNHVDMARRIYL